MGKYLIACVLAFAAAYAQAGMGTTQLGTVTVFYPAAAAEQPAQRGPFTMSLAPDAAPVRGNGRLVIVSHGSGGNPWVHTDVARALVDAGFVVAMPTHRGDSRGDTSDAGPVSWKRRPHEVSQAIDAVGADARFAPLLALDKVGVLGQSAGGHTALVMAGGRWSPARFKQHCDANIAQDFHACVGLYTRLRGDALDAVKIKVALGVLRERFDEDEVQSHRDPRIAAAVAGVPAAAHFDHASLAQPAVPLALVTAGLDKWLAPRFHSDRVLAACQPRCELLASLPQGGHSILLSPPPPMAVLDPLQQDLLGDPPGFDRAVLRDVDHRIAAFMRKHLLP